MMESRFDPPTRPMSRAQVKTMEALELLPASYKVNLDAPKFKLSDEAEDWGFCWYRPSFMIVHPAGMVLMVDANSEMDLSLVSLVSLTDIGETIEKAGKLFVLLSWACDDFPSQFKGRPEFDSLHLHMVRSAQDVLRAVDDEFSSLTTSAPR